VSVSEVPEAVTAYVAQLLRFAPAPLRACDGVVARHGIEPPPALSGPTAESFKAFRFNGSDCKKGGLGESALRPDWAAVTMASWDSSVRSWIPPLSISKQSSVLRTEVSDPLLEEDICLIEPTDLSCMMSERYWVRVPCSSGFTYIGCHSIRLICWQVPFEFSVHHARELGEAIVAQFAGSASSSASSLAHARHAAVSHVPTAFPGTNPAQVL
jgi:hypothetical protein